MKVVTMSTAAFITPPPLPQAFASNTSHPKKNSARYYNICALVLMYSTHYYCQIVMTLRFSQQISEVYSNIKFHENEFSGSRVVPCRRTDGQTDMRNLTVAFRNFANALKTDCGKWMIHMDRRLLTERSSKQPLSSTYVISCVAKQQQILKRRILLSKVKA